MEGKELVHGLQYDVDMTASTSLLERLGGFNEGGGELATDLAAVAVPPEITFDKDADRLLWDFETREEREALKRRLRRGQGRERDLQLHLKTVGTEALQQFIQLASAPPQKIVEFAQRWGVLNVCRKHYLPSSHESLCDAAFARRDGSRWEPLTVWRHFANEAALILRATEAVRERDAARCAELSNAIFNSTEERPLPKPRVVHPYKPNERGPLSFLEFEAMFEAVIRMGPDRFSAVLRDETKRAAFINDCCDGLGVSRGSAERKLREFIKWLPHRLQILDEVLSWSEQKKREMHIQGAANVVAGRINEWLKYGAVKPSITWKSGKVVLSLRSGGWEGEGLFGALAIQLLMAVSAVQGFALCSGCGTAYQPIRKPPTGKRHYCKACGIRVAQRDASQAYRHRMKLLEKKKPTGKRRGPSDPSS